MTTTPSPPPPSSRKKTKKQRSSVCNHLQRRASPRALRLLLRLPRVECGSLLPLSRSRPLWPNKERATLSHAPVSFPVKLIPHENHAQLLRIPVPNLIPSCPGLHRSHAQPPRRFPLPGPRRHLHRQNRAARVSTPSTLTPRPASSLPMASPRNRSPLPSSSSIPTANSPTPPTKPANKAPSPPSPSTPNPPSSPNSINSPRLAKILAIFRSTKPASISSPRTILPATSPSSPSSRTESSVNTLR